MAGGIFSFGVVQHTSAKQAVTRYSKTILIRLEDRKKNRTYPSGMSRRTMLILSSAARQDEVEDYHDRANHQAQELTRFLDVQVLHFGNIVKERRAV